MNWVSRKLEKPPYPLLLWFFLILFIPRTAGGEEVPDPASTQQKSHLRTVIVSDYYPYTFVNKEGIPDGFSVDLAKAVTKVMGMDLEIDVDKWEQARRQLETGDIDFLPMMAYSKERGMIYDFSVPHTIAYDAFFTRKDSKWPGLMEDLKGQTVIVMKGDQAHDYLLASGLVDPEHLILVGSLPEALGFLASGKGDVALMPKLVGLMVLKDLNLTNLTQTPVVVESYNRPFSFAVKKGNQSLLERLNQGLSIITKSGQYREIYEKSFGVLEPTGLPWRSIFKYIAGVAAVFTLFASALFLWNVSLRRQVALRTERLEAEILERRKAEASLRETEELFRLFVSHSPIYVYIKEVTPIESRVLQASDNFNQMIGIPGSKMIGKTMSELFPADFAAKITADDWAVVSRGAVLCLEESLDGRDYTTIKFPIVQKGRALLAGYTIDITDSKRAEEERAKLEAQLHRVQKMEAIGTLAGGIAHDFNNILGAILGYSEMILLDIPESGPLRDDLTQVLNAAYRAKDLVKQILVFSRMKTGQEIQYVDVGKTITEALRFLRASLPSTIEIRKNIDGKTFTTLADPTQLHEALINLCTNAAHAMEAKGGLLEISLSDAGFEAEIHSTHPDAEKGAFLRLTVADTGHGMDAETMEHIFEPYFTTKEVGKGTGLGLALVHGIVTRYGGAIEVRSEVGKGTTFHVYLPSVCTAEDMKLEETEPVPKGTERILFVDDEEMLTHMAKRILGQLGYQVHTTTSSLEALNRFRKGPHEFDMVITDYTMPGMTGVELAKEIFLVRSDIPIVLCTGFSEKIDEQKASEACISAFMMKPVSINSMARVIRQVLDHRAVNPFTP